MKAGVTGATGFLGSYLCRRLAAEGYQLVVLRRPQSRGDRLEDLDLDTVIGDVTDPVAVSALVRGCDAVFHTAAVIR